MLRCYAKIVLDVNVKRNLDYSVSKLRNLCKNYFSLYLLIHCTINVYLLTVALGLFVMWVSLITKHKHEAVTYGICSICGWI